MLQILQARRQHYVNREHPDVQSGFRKGRSRDQIANIHWIIKQENSRKTSTTLSLTRLMPLTMWIITNCEKFLKRWEYQTILPVSWETSMQIKKQQLEPCMEQLTCSRLRRDTRLFIAPCLFNLYTEHIMQNAGLYGLQAEIKIARRNIKNIRYADDTTLMAESKEELKSLLMRVKEKSEKSWLKTQY